MSHSPQSKIFKTLFKIIISLALLVLSLFLILYALDTLGVTNISMFDNFQQTSVGKQLLEWHTKYGFRYSMVLYSSIVLFSYLSFWIFLGAIPFGKIPRFIINFILGGPIVGICLLLIIVGGILIATM